MIGMISGKVCNISKNFLIIDVKGLGYIVYCSTKLIASTVLNQSITLMTQIIIREKDINLYGFTSDIEKEFFNYLIGIQGVGAKLAQTVLSIYSADEITLSLQNEKILKFSKITGVGPKLAARLTSELRSKKFIRKVQSTHENRISTDEQNKIADARSGLANLGYTERDITLAFQKIPVSLTLQDMIKAAIKNIIKFS
jgi:Holliday junction DNA helicase RuvA